MTGRWTRGALLSRSARARRRGARRARRPRGSTPRRVAAKTVNVGFIYSKTGGLSAFGGEESRRLPRRPRLHEGQVRRLHDQPDVHRRRDRSGDRDHRVQEPGRPGREDHRGHRRRRASRSSSGRSLRRTTSSTSPSRRRVRRDHRPEPEHVPRRPADAAGRASTRGTSSRPKSTGKKVVVFAEDTAFGQGNVAAVKLIFGSKGHTIS